MDASVRGLLDAIPHAVWIVGAEGRALFLNRRGRETLGVEGLGDFAGAVHPDDRHLLRGRFAGEEPFELELRLIAAGGRTLAHALHAERGAGGWVVTCTELETRRQADRAREETAAILDTIVGQAPIGIGFVDRELRFVHVNEQLARFIGSTAAERRGRLVGEVIPRARQAFADIMAELGDGEPARRGVPFVSRAGSLGSELRGDFVPVRMGDELLGIAVLMIDVGEQRRSAVELEKSERRHRTLVESMAEFVFVNDVHGAPITLSGADAYGEAASATESSGWIARVHADERARVRVAWDHSLATGTPFHEEYRFHAADGWRDVVVRATPVRDNAGVVYEWIGFVQNITARKRNEAALQTSERRYRSLVEAISEFVWSADASGTPRHTTGGDNYVGPGNAAIAFDRWLELVHPDDRDRLITAWQDSIAAGKPLHTEYRVRRLDGEWRDLVGHGVPVRDAAGRVVEWVGVLDDVTEVTRATLRLHETMAELENARAQAEKDHALLHTLIKTAPVGIAFVDPDLVIIAANETIESGDAGLGDESQARMRQVLATGEALLEVPSVGRARAEPTRLRHRLSSYYPVRIDDKVIGVGLIVVDVTAQKSAEETLHKERDLLQVILDGVDDGIVACDPEGALTVINRATHTMHDIPDEAVAPERWAERFDLFHPDGTTPMRPEEVPLYRALRGELVRDVECVIAPHDLPPRFITASGRALVGPGGEKLGAVVVIHDVTARRALETKLRQAQKMEVVGQLAGGVAHDFNNLLTVIAGCADMLIHQLGRGDPAQELAREILEAGKRATGLTRQLLAFSRKSVVAPQLLDLNDVVHRTRKMLDRLIGEDVTLVTALAPVVSPIFADPGQIEQLLMNLILNARDAMPGGGTVKIESRDALLDDEYAAANPGVSPGLHVLLVVSDTGSGMSPDVLRHLYEPFFTTKGPGRGTGLGLATVYGIVQQAGGHVTVASTLGEGTRFTIAFPASRERLDPAAPSGERRAVPRGRETILLVEDEASVRAFCRQVLAGSGYRVIEAADGRDALLQAELHQGTIDALITDVVMPGMSGRMIADLLAQQNPALKVMYLSGYTDDHVIRHGVMSAEVHFLEKPFDAAALARKVRELLDGSP